MPEDQIPPEKSKLPRRAAIALAGAGLTALIATIYGKYIVDPDDPQFQLISAKDKAATQVAFANVEDKLREQSSALSKDSQALTVEMAKIPRALVESSVKIDVRFSGDAIAPGEKSAAVSSVAIASDLIVMTDHVIFPTADQKIENHISELVRIDVSTPQLPDQHRSSHAPSQFQTFRLPGHQLLIVKFANPILENTQHPRVNTDWYAREGETVHSLSYPAAALGTIGYWPQSAEVKTIRKGYMILGGTIGPGSSGGGVVNKDGELVGILTNISPSGPRATRLGRDFATLLERAKS